MPQKYTKKERTKKVKRIVKKMDLAKVRGDKYGKQLRNIISSEMEKLLGKPDVPVMKKVAKKSIARRLVGKHLAKAIPGVGYAMLAHEAVKGVSKATCSKRGGKWVGGKCKGAKKDTRKITSPQVRDPISKR